MNRTSKHYCLSDFKPWTSPRRENGRTPHVANSPAYINHINAGPKDAAGNGILVDYDPLRRFYKASVCQNRA